MDDIEDRDVQYFSKRLQSLSVIIKGLSVLSAISAISNIVPLIFLLSNIQRAYYMGSDMILFSTVTLFTTLAVLYAYDLMKRQGDAVFEELSDELQWHLGRDSKPYKNSGLGDRPQLPIRVIMREYIFGTDLPLTRGKSGMQYYLILSTALWVITILVSAILIQKSFS